MIKLNPIPDDDPLLDQSKLLYALEQMIHLNESTAIIVASRHLRCFAHCVGWVSSRKNAPARTG